MVEKRLSTLRKTLHLDEDPAPPASSPPAPPAAQTLPAAPATIHKGAYVDVRLYLEGDQPPAQDFAKTATEAARKVVEAGLAAGKTPLKVTIKKVEADDDPPDADEADQADEQG